MQIFVFTQNRLDMIKTQDENRQAGEQQKKGTIYELTLILF